MSGTEEPRRELIVSACREVKISVEKGFLNIFEVRVSRKNFERWFQDHVPVPILFQSSYYLPHFQNIRFGWL